MDLSERLRQLAGRIPAQLDFVSTEEATKNAFVMPFIGALGYDVFNPQEVTPELVADVGTKKGEKVDYAILEDGEPIMLFECKHCGADLQRVHASQLYRYFSVTSARIAVVTNGVKYHFFSDLDAPNKMDATPFLEIDILNLTENAIEELRKFSREAFDVEAIVAAAGDLKYTAAVKQLLSQELSQPSDEFIRFLTSQVYKGRLTPAVKDQFAPIVRRALKEYISDRIARRLRSALESEPDLQEERETVAADEVATAAVESHDGIETTEAEIEAFYIVKAILSEVIDPSRVFMRDAKSYCAILLDDNNRRTICRLRFNATQKYVGLFDEQREEEKRPIDGPNDIFGLASDLKAAVKRYDDPEARASAT